MTKAMKFIFVLLPAFGVMAYGADEPKDYDIDVRMVNVVATNKNVCSMNMASFAGSGFVSANGTVTNIGISLETESVGERYRILSPSFGSSVERTKFDYYLGDELILPDNCHWVETCRTNAALVGKDILINHNSRKIYIIGTGKISFTFIVDDNGVLKAQELNMMVSHNPKDRPKRLYWTDNKNYLPIDLSGKYVKIFANEKSAGLFNLVQSPVTNLTGGMQFVVTNITRGVYIDTASQMLFATCDGGKDLHGTFVIAYYDSENYDNMLHTETVEVLGPDMIIQHASVGDQLFPSGRGYKIDNLRARPTMESIDIDSGSSDGYGAYIYQHKGMYAYSAKNDAVFALRPNWDSDKRKFQSQKTQITWYETDEMGVDWPFEINRYEVKWPDDAVLYVRGNNNGDGKDAGRPIYFPEGYSAELQKCQQSDDFGKSEHARAVNDGKFETWGCGYSLLKVTGDDNVWFIPIHSILRTDEKYFVTNAVSNWTVGREVTLRGGSESGVTANFYAECLDARESPGYIYKPVSGNNYNPQLYHDPLNAKESAYQSVIYGVNESKPDESIEVWWNSVYRQEDMPLGIEIPSLPQRYAMKWPGKNDNPQIVIASQLGSAGTSVFSQNMSLVLDGPDASIAVSERNYFSPDGGTVQFRLRAGDWGNDYLPNEHANASFLVVGSSSKDSTRIIFDLQKVNGDTNLVVSVTDKMQRTTYGAWTNSVAEAADDDGWFSAGVTIDRFGLGIYLNGKNKCVIQTPQCASLLNYVNGIAIGKHGYNEYAKGGLRQISGGRFARSGVQIGELLLWYGKLSDEQIVRHSRIVHDGKDSGLSGCFTFIDGVDLQVRGNTDVRYIYEKTLNARYTARHCLAGAGGPPAEGNGRIVADNDTTPAIYYENDVKKTGYNPNEEHAFITPSGEGHVAWALRCDLNTQESSEPGVLVSYVQNGRPKMQFLSVAVTNDVYPRMAGEAVAGLPLPGPHPLDLLENPWQRESHWKAVDDSSIANAPFWRDRKGQFWARAAGCESVYMYYPNQPGFAFPGLSGSDIPKSGAPVAWLKDWEGNELHKGTDPTPWEWTIVWPENVPEIEVGRTLTTAASGLPEVWNAKSLAVVWPGYSYERSKTVTLFDPTVAQSGGFFKYSSVAQAIADIGITVGKDGNAHLKNGKYYFDNLPPSISERFYMDTTADVENCLKLIGKKEYNPGGVELLHVNVLADDERKAIKALFPNKSEWIRAVNEMAKSTVVMNELRYKRQKGNVWEQEIAYTPRDKYALFTEGETNYVTLVENDAIEKNMGVQDGDPISMKIMKVVPKYYLGRIVTRQDPVNLLSQQLNVIYEDAFAGKGDGFEFEWRRHRPNPDGTVPKNFGDYDVKAGANGRGITKFVIGAQGDTLANMVNTYYTMRYRSTDENSAVCKAHAANDGWSEWVDPPALAEGWVQRVLNNVTPFTQRMRDLYENEAETAVTMIRQAGAPFEGDVALNQDNLKEVGLIQLYETVLNKAESMSLLTGINDLDANKQLQLAVGRLAELYNVLGDEAYSDALNPTIGFGVEGSDKLANYGADWTGLFCFDNQVRTLLDEELALLRGRDGENAPEVTLSPYYNRLVWNFTRGLSAGEVAYAVNYDISGHKTSTIDYQQAAEMFPQGHGDAYGHYLSALKGYYRLLRNPNFSWGPASMGEMVVADSAMNVDYFDEAQFAKSAVNVAKTALEVVDRTARAAYRDNGNAAEGAGYLDGGNNPRRAFGYGEWGSRGGYGALCNWAVGNTLVPEEPKPGRYYRYKFTGEGSEITTVLDGESQAWLNTNQPWTVEFQLAPSAESATASTNRVLCLEDDSEALAFELASGEAGEKPVLQVSVYDKVEKSDDYEIYFITYTNNTSKTVSDFDTCAKFCATNHVTKQIVAACFLTATPPRIFPIGVSTNSTVPISGNAEGSEEDLTINVPVNDMPAMVGDGLHETNYLERVYKYTEKSKREILELRECRELCEIETGKNSLVAFGYAKDILRTEGTNCIAGTGVRVFDDKNAIAYEDAFTNLTIDVRCENVTLGGGFNGELGEFRLWWNRYMTDEELVKGRKGVALNGSNKTLAEYLRTTSATPNPATIMGEDRDVTWFVTGGEWLEERESNIDLTFKPEGLKRIDRATVTELKTLADTGDAIQRKIDQLDAGMNPLGLSKNAIPFDITPIGAGDGTSTHFEQIRARAETAIANARKVLEKAQNAGSRLRLLEESQQTRVDKLDTMELEFKNKLIEYYGYPYSGDIGPGKTYPQGYDGPDIYHYAWMDPTKYGLTNEIDTKPLTTNMVEFAMADDATNVYSFVKQSLTSENSNTLKFEISASGIVLKPNDVTGKRYADGKIQEALGAFLTAKAKFDGALDLVSKMNNNFEVVVKNVGMSFTAGADVYNTAQANKYDFMAWYDSISTYKIQLQYSENAKTAADVEKEIWTMSSPPWFVAGVANGSNMQEKFWWAIGSSVYGVQSLPAIVSLGDWNRNLAKKERDVEKRQAEFDALVAAADWTNAQVGAYETLWNAWLDQYNAAGDVEDAFREMVTAQQKVESMVAEASRMMSERELARQQAVNEIAKERYNEMFFRLMRNNALTRYSSAFDLAQKYVYFAAQAYDYETGLLSADRMSGDRFINEIIGARSLGSFTSGGEVMAAGENGDGGLSDILARLDANWLVLKPRLGINNPQPYATWFSLRRELFRIKDGEAGDKAWQQELRKYWVDDLSKDKRFVYHCQPFHRDQASVMPEPGLVIPFSSEITFGKNFFGEELTGGDAALDSSWYATHIKSAGVYFEGYNERVNGYRGSLPLATKPLAYLVPVGRDTMRLAGDEGRIIGWNVIDQTIPAPYEIGSWDLDDPGWVPLFTGYTAGNDAGARIRKHPSFRAYYGALGVDPVDEYLDCTRLIGRSAWNTQWILVIPAGAMDADRAKALGVFIDGYDANRDGTVDVSGVKDVKVGFKTYSKSGN